jgi:hypothetical protein
MAMERRKRAASEEPVLPDAGGGVGPLASCPSLLEWLTDVAWTDGSVRTTGTVMIFVEGGRWKAWLHDRDALEGCFVSATTLAGLLTAVEGVLEEGGGDWRPDRKGGRRSP